LLLRKHVLDGGCKKVHVNFETAALEAGADIHAHPVADFIFWVLSSAPESAANARLEAKPWRDRGESANYFFHILENA